MRLLLLIVLGIGIALVGSGFERQPRHVVRRAISRQIIPAIFPNPALPESLRRNPVWFCDSTAARLRRMT